MESSNLFSEFTTVESLNAALKTIESSENLELEFLQKVRSDFSARRMQIRMQIQHQEHLNYYNEVAILRGKPTLVPSPPVEGLTLFEVGFARLLASLCGGDQFDLSWFKRIKDWNPIHQEQEAKRIKEMRSNPDYIPPEEYWKQQREIAKLRKSEDEGEGDRPSGRAIIRQKGRGKGKGDDKGRVRKMEIKIVQHSLF